MTRPDPTQARRALRVAIARRRQGSTKPISRPDDGFDAFEKAYRQRGRKGWGYGIEPAIDRRRDYIVIADLNPSSPDYGIDELLFDVQNDVGREEHRYKVENIGPKKRKVTVTWSKPLLLKVYDNRISPTDLKKKMSRPVQIPGPERARRKVKTYREESVIRDHDGRYLELRTGVWTDQPNVLEIEPTGFLGVMGYTRAGRIDHNMYADFGTGPGDWRKPTRDELARALPSGTR